MSQEAQGTSQEVQETSQEAQETSQEAQETSQEAQETSQEAQETNVLGMIKAWTFKCFVAVSPVLIEKPLRNRFGDVFCSFWGVESKAREKPERME